MPKHILFILSDQHNASVMGCAGNTIVSTPNLDHLAARGTSLEACSCASPLCVPSRSSLLSTLLPSRTGVFTNAQCLPSDRLTFVHQLALSGMHTVLAGRMHFKGPDQRHGFRERLVGDIGDTHWGYREPGHPLFRCYGGEARALEEACGGESHVLAYDREVTRAACEYLESWDAETPLFLTVGFYGPHNPYVCPPDLFQKYMERLPDEPEMPAEETLHPAVREHLKWTGVQTLPPEVFRRSKAAYYGMIEQMDRHIGRILEAARSLGDDVLIVYASDHGDMAGEKGLFWKSVLFEGAVRVPVLMQAPDIPPGIHLRTPTSLMDIGPTLLAAVGAEAMRESDGVNLWPALRRGEEPATERPIVSQYCIHRPPHGAMVRKGPWKLIRFIGHERPQLFHLDQDPGEEVDLAVNPDANTQDILAELNKYLDEVWDPEFALETARSSRFHSQRLVKFHQLEQKDMPDVWWQPEGWTESRNA